MINPIPITPVIFRLLSKKRSKPIRHRAANADGVLEAGLDVLVASSASPVRLTTYYIDRNKYLKSHEERNFSHNFCVEPNNE